MDHQIEQKLRRYGVIRQFFKTKFDLITKQSSVLSEAQKDEIAEAQRLSDMPFILKSKRIEYVFEKTRRLQERIDLSDPTALSLAERADLELVNDVRFWTAKYMTMSTLLGANIGYFSYRLMVTSLHWYVALPLGFASYFVSRNLIMRNCMDRVYFSMEHVFKRYREEAKPKEIQEKKPTVSAEDKAKHEIMTMRKRNLLIEKQAQARFEAEKEERNQQLRDLIQHVHGRWINETDFSPLTYKELQEKSFGDRNYEAILIKDIEKTGDSAKNYNKFVDLYLKLYYEPLDLEYEELRYFTKDSDRKLAEIINDRAVRSIEIK